MATLPDFTYGTITGRVLAARLPEITGGGPVAGVFPLARVNLKATRPPWVQVTEGDKALVLLPEYRLHMTDEGELKNPVTGEPDAEVIATDDPLAGPFAWHVTVEVPGRVRKFEGYLEVPAGTTADLADAVVADPSGPNTPEWVKLRDEVLALIGGIPGTIDDYLDTVNAAFIDDGSPSTSKVYSSQRTADLIEATQYDTGWRNLDSLLENGWTVTAGARGLLVRRVGDLVMVHAEGLVPGTAASLVSLPVGFRSPGRVPASAYIGSGTVPIYSRVITGNVQCNNSTSPTAWRDVSCMFFTSDPRPATLPGTPA